MKTILIFVLLFTSINTFAVTPIEKGEIAPHSGYIFTKEEEKKVRKIREEKLRLEDLNILKTQKINILERKLADAKVGEWKKWVYFGLGVILTSAAVYGAGQLTRR